MRTLLRQSAGMTRVVVHLVRGALTMALVMPVVGAERRRAIVERWSRGVLSIFGLELAVEGAPPAAGGAVPVLLVGNHISWIDIYAYLAVADVRFVAKSEVRGWPLIGWFASRLGTIFVERDRPRDALRVTAEMRQALDQGQLLCVFPEGTTTDGSVVLPFSPVLIAPAVERGASVWPVSIAYCEPSGAPSRRTAFTGDATLVASIWSLAAGEPGRVDLRFLDPIPADGLDRRAIARRAEEAVRASLGQLRAAPAGVEGERSTAAPSATGTSFAA
jgi:1-acyl-sn-glycerol-3-phosphate acyltransferase